MLWVLHVEEVWWPSIVLYVQETDRRSVTGFGTIQYEDFRGFNEQTVKVSICLSEDNGSLLRHIHEYVISEVLLSWTFASEDDIFGGLKM